MSKFALYVLLNGVSTGAVPVITSTDWPSHTIRVFFSVAGKSQVTHFTWQVTLVGIAENQHPRHCLDLSLTAVYWTIDGVGWDVSDDGWKYSGFLFTFLIFHSTSALGLALLQHLQILTYFVWSWWLHLIYYVGNPTLILKTINRVHMVCELISLKWKINIYSPTC